ncbi:permease prefix domain 2-containing transporter [Spirosoma sp. RP8]|uniref:Permease prefix domain 2-containing transporter n=1 Tax=Spirosoma liriopis TaxID=2937440 RepID=A0ABT0HMN0_9BACT|nr:ABC transporter permease [Spirosoma liriopis]MCK8493427.1 permease prefix domain 2-containing transporter [Spirosoma liriopis]
MDDKLPTPPAWADRLLKWVCPPELLEELLGDLHEQFAEQVIAVGEQKARQDYLLEVIKFVRPYFIRQRAVQLLTQKTTLPDPLTTANNISNRSIRSQHKASDYPRPLLVSPDMLRNYLKIAFRTLWKSKGYAAINVVGLSVAFCICSFLFLTAYLQLTFDQFHQDSDRIFQAYLFSNDPQKVSRTGTLPLPLMPALKADYPEIEAATRLVTGRKSLVEVKGRYFDKLVSMTDPDFLKIFSFPLIKGNRANALNNLSSIVLSESMARAAFGTEDPIGKPVKVGSDNTVKQYIVSGVIRDAPYNSSIRYDALVRVENAPSYQTEKENWSAFFHPVFVKLPARVDPITLEERLKPFTQKYFPGNLEELVKKGAKPDQRGDIMAVRLQKLTNVHFDRDISNGRGAPIAVVYVLLGIAFFILLIACINFINLNIARSFTRAREVGVRKSLGALKNQLFVQIGGEATLICLIGFLVGLLLTYLLFPQFNATFDSRLSFDYLLQPGFVALMLSVFILVALVAGGYPAWQMTKFNAVEVLKGKISMRRPGILRNSLIVTQFAMSCLLACCTIIAAQQVDYLRTRPLGFQKEQVISIPVGNQVNGRQVLQRLRNKLATDPAVLAVTGTGVNLGQGKDRVSSRSTIGLTYKGKKIATDWLLVDYDYVKTLNIRMLSGRDFNRAYAADSVDRVVVTESLAKQLGETNPVGTYFRDDEDTTGAKSQIIGVVADFHLYSVADEKNPIMMHVSHSEPIHYIFVRVSESSLAGAMDKLKSVWNEVAPQAEFMGSFLDENVDAWYQNEEMLSRLFSLASGIAILLSCLGLFAIALMAIEQRTKEIGIRKVMGASIPSLVVVLSQDFVKLVIIALAISTPIAWLGMQSWLTNYTEHVAISVWVFVLVGLGAVLIALATISIHSVKAALMNPVKSLRSE